MELNLEEGQVHVDGKFYKGSARGNEHLDKGESQVLVKVKKTQNRLRCLGFTVKAESTDFTNYRWGPPL